MKKSCYHGYRFPRRCGSRRRLRITHPQLGTGLRHLLAAEVVVPDGARSAKVVQATQHSNSDLLWACHGGGGGNFGIATSYTLKLHELKHVEFAIAMWTGHEHLGDLLRAWQRDAPVADERLTSALEVDSTAVGLFAVLHGGSRQELDGPGAAPGEPEASL
jgi:FAD/FMN-containing dehydrogenase